MPVTLINKRDTFICNSLLPSSEMFEDLKKAVQYSEEISEKYFPVVSKSNVHHTAFVSQLFDYTLHATVQSHSDVK